MVKKMAKIKTLSSDIVSKIAAGQVVERPASVIKELVENSLDAGATRIVVDLVSAGKKKISVFDNGHGMSKDDLLKSFLPHTTSKISSADDLVEIRSFGFRGEALSSMVSVAKTRIESKIKGQLSGNYVEIFKENLHDSGIVGMSFGTTVTVINLFSNTPARKKFLKTDSTEMADNIKILTNIAIAHHNVGFKLVHNKKTILDLPENHNLQERIESLLGSHITENLLPLKISDDHFELTGFVGKPQISTSSKSRQFLFVNGRPVKNKLFSNIIKEVFSTLLEPRAHPAFLLFINLEPNLIDVNVTPQKTEVKFVIEKEIKEALKIGVKNVLEKADLTYKNKGGYQKYYEEFGMDFGTAQVLRSKTDGWSVKDVELEKGSEVLQVHNLYLVTQTKNGLLIVDQHAAHERILYEEYLAAFKTEKKKNNTTQLKKTVKLELPIEESIELKNRLSDFEELGFKIKEIKNSFEVFSIPTIFKTRNITKLITEVLHDSLEFGDKKEIDVATHRTIAYLACRTAIKAGDKLTPKERKRLIEKIFETKTKYTCPHGRPVEVELDLKSLNMMFKRFK
jgi:DNA mismatch repair protein MutL